MAIINDSNAIPDRFRSSYDTLSDTGKEEIKKILNINSGINQLSSIEEILNIVFNVSLDCCKHYFNKNIEVSLIHDYKRNGLDVKSGSSNIYMNETLINSLLQYILVVIYFSLDFKNPEVDLYCYRKLLFITNEQCNNTYVLPKESDFIEIMGKYPDIKTLNVAYDVYWGIITFLILHELAHIFLGHFDTKKEYIISEREYEADKAAYLIFLDMIYNKSRYNTLEFLEEYIYLAPMMAIDFFTLVNFVDGTINETRYFSRHPPHEERKDFLFDLFDKWDCEFNTVEGNGIYNWYVDVVEKFKKDLFNANEQGMLDLIKRNKERKMQEENIVGLITEITDEITETNILTGAINDLDVNQLIDTHVCFIADESKSDFVLMNLKGGTARSFKLTNIIIDFKGMLDTLIELALTSSVPSSAAQTVKLALFIVYKIFSLSIAKLSEIDAQVLLFLHKNNAYEKHINENEVIHHFILNGLAEKNTVYEAINNLLKIKCIDILNGKIALLEKLYLR